MGEGMRIGRWQSVFSLVVVAAAARGWCAGSPAPPQPHVQLEMLADTTAVTPGRPFSVGVRCRIDPGWHIYWKNPGDAGLATEFRLAAPPGFTISPDPWPLPERFEQGPGLNGFGYTREVVFLWRLTPPTSLEGVARIRLAADVRWLACQKMCVPGSGEAALSLPIGPAATAANGAFFAEARSRLPKTAGEPGTPASVRVEGSLATGTPAGRFLVEVFWREPVQVADWFPGPSPALEITALGTETRAGTSRIRFAARRLAGQSLPAEPYEILVTGVDRSGRRTGVTVIVPLEPRPAGNAPGRSQ